MSSFEAHPLGWSLLLVVFMGIAMVKELMVDINRDFLRKSCSPNSTLRQLRVCSLFVLAFVEEKMY